MREVHVEVEVWVPFGLFVVIAGSAVLPEPVEADGERRQITWTADEGHYRLRWARGPVPEGLPYGELVVQDDPVHAGSLDALMGGDLQIVLPPGCYRVGIQRDGERSFTLLFEAVERFVGPPPEGPILGERLEPDRSFEVPVLDQLDLPAAWLRELLIQLGRAARRGAHHLSDGPVLAGDQGVVRYAQREAGAFPFGLSADPTAPWSTCWPSATWDEPEVEHERALYAFALDRDPPRIGVRVLVAGDALVDAALCLPWGQSHNDRQECTALVARGWSEGRPVPLGVPRGPLPVELVWSERVLTVRVGPCPSTLRVGARVIFEDAGGAPVDRVEVRPLWHDGERLVYEVWLVGQRRGLRRARVELLDGATAGA